MLQMNYMLCELYLNKASVKKKKMKSEHSSSDKW